MRTPGARAIWIFLTLAGLAYFLWRGPLRAGRPHGNADFELLLTAAETFRDGGDPYSRREVEATALKHGRWRIPKYLNASLLYPPGFLSLFVPLTYLPYRGAAAVWMVVELASVAVLLGCAARLASLGAGQSLWLASLGLFWAPIHTGFAHGQPSIVFCALAAALFLLLKRRAQVGSGIALGLLALKVTFGLPAALLATFSRAWRPLAVAAAVTVLLSLPMLLRDGVSGSVIRYYHAVKSVQEEGQDADDSRANPNRFDLINLRSWLYSGGLPRVAAEVINAAVIGTLLAVLFRFRSAAGSDRLSGLYFGLVGVVLCLCLYHRFYDAALLIVAVAAVIKLAETHRAWALGSGICLFPAVVPGAAALRHWLGADAATPPWVEAIIIRHLTPLMVVLALLLWWQLARQRRQLDSPAASR